MSLFFGPLKMLETRERKEKLRCVNACVESMGEKAAAF